MSDQRPFRVMRRIRLGLALTFIAVGGAAAVWNQHAIPLGGAPRTRVVGRVWTRLPGVDVAGLKVQLVKRDGTFPPGPLLGMNWVETDASGRFELAGDVAAKSEGEAEVYLHSSPAADRWTYRPAVLTLQPGRTVQGIEVELVEGVEVEGRLVGADPDDPIAPVKVAVMGPGKTSFLGLIAPIRDTDDRGSFRFRLIPGEVELIAFALPAAYAKSYPSGFRQTVEVPRGVRSITLPPLRLRSAQK